MGARMELVAGDAREVLAVLGSDERGGFDDRTRFHAYLSMGGGIDPTWLDLFAEAARSSLDREAPTDFLEARIDIGTTEPDGDLTVERVDPGWVMAVARIGDGDLDGITGRWIDLLEEEMGPLPAEEKPWIRDLAGQIVRFCRTADRAPDVVFVWALR